MEETWKNIKEYEGLYQVSNLGRVKSFAVYKQGKILRPIRTHKGYLTVVLSKDKKEKRKRIHRLVAEEFIPNPKHKEQVNHINGNKTDNRINNLEWVTCQENVKHAWNTGLAAVNKNFLEAIKKSMHYRQYNGEKMSLVEIANSENISYTMLWKRVIKDNVPLDEAVKKGKVDRKNLIKRYKRKERL